MSKRNSHRYLDQSRRSKKPIRADWSVIRKLNVDGSEIVDNAGSAESIDEDEQVENVPLWVRNMLERKNINADEIGLGWQNLHHTNQYRQPASAIQYAPLDL